MPRFKDAGLQRIYDLCRSMAADTTSEFYIEGRPRRGAGHRAAYWNGRAGKPSSWPTNSLAHAAWAAGQDDLKELGPVEGSEYSLRPRM